MGYVAKNPRITVKFIDADTERVLFEYSDKTWMEIGELFTAHFATELSKREKKEPKNLMVLAVQEFRKV